MKASELRIGNYVWNEVQNMAVKVNIKILAEQYSKEGHLKKTGIDLGLWTPVPLTEEWLAKFGSKEIPNYDGDWPCYELQGLRFEFIDGEVMLEWRTTSAPCKYVHQLQNLYFALTGKELIADN